MPRSRKEAIQWGRGQVGKSGWYRLCLMFVRSTFGVAAKYPRAIDAWHGAAHKHQETDYNKVPRGVPYFWGNSGAGHVVLTLGKDSAGYRLCLSNDIKTAGVINIARMKRIEEQWGMTPLGWTEDLNGVRVYTRPRRNRTPKYNRVVELAREIQKDAKGDARDAAERIERIARRHSTKY